MISVEEARERILAGLRPTPAEVVALADAWGRVTARPIVARLTQPPADVSAMDGYAVRVADGTEGAVLEVIGGAPAGHPFAGRVGAGQAVRIFTGSVVPDGAEAILLQEDATRDGASVLVNEAVKPGRHIRRAGQDFAVGETILPAGRRMGARDVGLAASANHPWITVHRRPRIAVLATGDEIALPGEPLPPGGIVSSNSHGLAALVRAAGCDAIVLPVARDDLAAIAEVADAVAGMDMLVTTGGASVGDHDLVVAGLKERGLEVDFWKIAMRPGKPLVFGWFGPVPGPNPVPVPSPAPVPPGPVPGSPKPGPVPGPVPVPVLGLPGNPVSALVCAILFLIPALARLSGLPAAPPPVSTATLGSAVGANDARADHLRATFTRGAAGNLIATPFPVQDSAMLRRLAQADGLIVRAPHAPALIAGAQVGVIRFDQLGL